MLDGLPSRAKILARLTEDDLPGRSPNPGAIMNNPLPQNRRIITRPAIAVPACALLLIAVFVPVPLELRSQTLRAVFDFAHFSLAAGACWYLWKRLGWPGWAAFATVVTAAALCEFLQGFTGRCPATSDFLRGTFGALAVWICLSAPRPSISTVRWIGASVIVVALSAWPVSEFLLAAARLCIHVTSSVG
jgi:hypothetical protein